MAKVEKSCEVCLKTDQNKYCVNFPMGKLEYPKLAQAIGLRKFGEPVQTPGRWIKDCETYQRVVKKLTQAKA